MSLDLALFVEQATWLGPLLPDSTRAGVIAWLGQRLEPDARARFLEHFPLSHPAQRRAEVALRRLLGRALTVNGTRLRATDEVTRSVDWTLTYVRSLTIGRPPLPLLARERLPIPDRACLGGLISIAQRWNRLLALGATTSNDYAHRAELLREAIDARSVRSISPVAFHQRTVARLRRLDSEAADDVASIQSALAFWSESFGAEGDQAGLTRLGNMLDEADAQNVDTLLEATVALSIARAATQAEAADQPAGTPWSILTLDTRSGKYPVLTLASGDLICEIAKGTPRPDHRGSERVKTPDMLSPWADEVLPPHSSGRSRASGRQPDLVVSFWLRDEPHRIVFAMGDAKRNATGDGETYLRRSLDVAATYLMSFGHRMGLESPTPARPEFRSRLMPAVTLFCRRGTGRPTSSALDRLRADTAPIVMAFDVEKDFTATMDPWHSHVLAAWLGSLGRQARAALYAARGTKLRQAG